MYQDLIDKINSECPYGQGIFKEPYGMPVHIKELVLYTRYETGGKSGGSYHEDSVAEPYTCSEPKDKFKVLDLFIKEMCPNVTYFQYKEIEQMIETDENTDYEYYGNCTDWKVEYIPFSKLIHLITIFNEK